MWSHHIVNLCFRSVWGATTPLPIRHRGCPKESHVGGGGDQNQGGENELTFQQIREPSSETRKLRLPQEGRKPLFDLGLKPGSRSQHCTGRSRRLRKATWDNGVQFPKSKLEDTAHKCPGQCGRREGGGRDCMWKLAEQVGEEAAR